MAEAEYHDRRALEENERALQATKKLARDIHLQLARHHEAAAKTIRKQAQFGLHLVR